MPQSHTTVHCSAPLAAFSPQHPYPNVDLNFLACTVHNCTNGCPYRCRIRGKSAPASHPLHAPQPLSARYRIAIVEACNIYGICMDWPLLHIDKGRARR